MRSTQNNTLNEKDQYPTMSGKESIVQLAALLVALPLLTALLFVLFKFL